MAPSFGKESGYGGDVKRTISPEQYIEQKGYFKHLKEFHRTSTGIEEGEWTTAQNQESSRESIERVFKTSVGEIAVQTDYGGENSKYEHNEDSVVLSATASRVVFAVVDGAGGSGARGSGAARLASRVVSGAVLEGVRRGVKDIVSLGKFVNEETLEQNVAYDAFATGVLVDMQIEHQKIRVGMVYGGDSKAMTLRNHMKYPAGTTRFQNFAQEEVDDGTIKPHEYYVHDLLNAATGGFGVPADAHFEALGTLEFEAEDGDCVVVASDGFWDMVSEYEVEQLSKQHDSAKALQKTLFNLAYERNNSHVPFIIQHDERTSVTKDAASGDNSTVVVLLLKRPKS